jgi:hypothetical protein
MIAGSRSFRLWTLLRKVFMGVSLVLIFGSTWLSYEYANTRPRAKTVVEGRVYGLNTHGDVVYLTRREKFLLDGLEATAALCMLSSLVLYWRTTKGGSRS